MVVSVAAAQPSHCGVEAATGSACSGDGCVPRAEGSRLGLAQEPFAAPSSSENSAC